MFQHLKFSSSIRAHGQIAGLLEKQAQPRGKHKSKGSSAVVLETAERHTDFSRGVWNALFRSPLKLDHDCSYTWRQETENWQEKENQQLPQTRSRHTGHFQRYHPKMGSTATAAPHQRAQGDCLRRRGSGKKSPSPPEGQTSPELTSSHLSSCPSHLFSAV